MHDVSMRQPLFHEHRVHDNVFMVPSLSRTVSAFQISLLLQLCLWAVFLRPREVRRAAGGASKSPRRAVPLHAPWKRDTVLSRDVGRSPRSAGDSEGGVPCDIDQDTYRNHVRDLLLQNKISGLEAFSVCGSASFWSTFCGRCCGCSSLKQMERQLGQRCPPSLLEGRRQAQRVLGSHFV